MQRRKYEEYAYVLDFLAEGKLDLSKQAYVREPLVQAIGENFFTLLELVAKKDAKITVHEKIFIGVGERDKIDHVKRRISYEDLTAAAKAELPYVIEEIVQKQEERFVRFFNTAHPLTTRMHQLELLPGIGKKLMWEILEERKKGPFKSFQDISERVRISDPKKMIIKRIIQELKNEDKYRIFTKSTIESQRR
ncbi:MAG: DUF655 domain-containing protein [Candidatus Odinarchaeia archaeon]